MKIYHSHPWNVSLEEAKKIQEELGRFVIKEDRFDKIRVIGGLGICFGSSSLAVSLVRFTYPDIKKLDSVSEIHPLSFPYIPGFFAFSCGPAVLSILGKTQVPDLIIFPGRGIAHPRRIGLASHLGILLNLPTIACSKRALTQNYKEPEKNKGSYEYMLEGKEKVGIALRSKNNTKPIFVSPGHRVSINSSLKVILRCCTKYRLPEPLREAQILARREFHRF
jgi:deoxyribonuclease V